MKGVALESLGELLALVGSALGTLVFTVAGVLVESAGLQHVFAGDIAVGGWELGMGALMIGVGLYLFGYQQFWQRLQLRRHAG